MLWSFNGHIMIPVNCNVWSDMTMLTLYLRPNLEFIFHFPVLISWFLLMIMDQPLCSRKDKVLSWSGLTWFSHSIFMSKGLQQHRGLPQYNGIQSGLHACKSHVSAWINKEGISRVWNPLSVIHWGRVEPCPFEIKVPRGMCIHFQKIALISI